jgi:4-hydroxy-2-oxoheptanedioate aldolase
MYGTTGPQTLVEVPTSIVSSTGKTKLQDALERARETGQPAVGQWMEFPGYSLARTVAAIGSDVSELDCYFLL